VERIYTLWYVEILSISLGNFTQMKTAMKCLVSPILLLLVTFLTGCGAQTVIVHDQDERSANEILTYLNDRNIPAVKEPAATSGGGGGTAIPKWNIKVDTTRANEAMAVLNAIGLPRRPGANLLDIFANTSLVPSETQELIRYQAGLAAQLSSIIRKFEGVVDAEVQLSFPKEDPLNPNAIKIPASAAIYVKHNGILDDPNSHLESKIRRLVANGVPNLSYDNVTVVGERTRYGDIGLESSDTESIEKPLVSIWSLIIAKESVTRFRVLFFSFFVSILVLLGFIVWLFWKLLPILKKTGGFGQLFSLKPLDKEEGKEVAKTGEKKAADDKSVTPPPKEPAKGAPPPAPAPPAAPPEAIEEEEYEEEETEGEGEEESDEGSKGT
jgi:type III secretion protein J